MKQYVPPNWPVDTSNRFVCLRMASNSYELSPGKQAERFPGSTIPETWLLHKTFIRSAHCLAQAGRR